MNGPIYWKPQAGRRYAQISTQTAALVSIAQPNVGTVAAAGAAIFRKTLSRIGTRVGSRQSHGWGNT